MEYTILLEAFKPFAKLLLVLAVAVFIGISMDYLTGTLAARKNHEWSSKKAREGIWHKVGIVISVLLAALFDGIIVVATQSVIKLPFNYCGLFAPLVALCYVVTETGSIIENLEKMGTPVPAFFKKGLAAFASKVDEKAESIIPDEAELHTEDLTLGKAVNEAEPVRMARFFVEDAEPPDEEDLDI